MTPSIRRRLFVFSLLLLLSSSSLFAQTTAATAGPAPASFSVTDLTDSQDFLVRATTHKRARVDGAAIERLLRSMTLKEKVGQMTQLEIGMISDGIDNNIHVNPEKLHKAVGEYGVGSILNVKDEALPLERWHEYLRAIQAEAAKSRLRVPVLYGIDSIHGANYVQGSTLFPQPIGMAATWNPELALQSAQVTAAETRAAAIPWTFSPVLDIGRQPLWPRLWETYGEDPYLAKTMGVAMVRGYQGEDLAAPGHIAACLKHYVGYSGPTSGHDRTPALLPELTLREYYLPTFRAAIDAGAASVMINSGEVNGVPGHASHFLLTTVLRNELHFDGVAVSDWEDIKKLVTHHHVAADEKEATRIAVMAGIDMSMVPSDYSFADLLVQLVKEGKVPMSRIDEAVRRILVMKARLGLFKDPLLGMSDRIGSPAARALSLQAARESITLLKNERNVLPLARSARVLVTGPTADSLIALNNGWTYTWQGDRPALYPKDRPTIVAALRQRLGDANVDHVPGADFTKVGDLAAVTAAAQHADVIVLCLGEPSYTETPGNIDDLDLPAAQRHLAEAVALAGKPVVLVLVEGRPRLIRSFGDAMSAIVLALNPSNEGGAALADVLLGDVNPSGRLPFTYPRHPNALLTYDRKQSEDTETAFGQKAFMPQFEFGFGLSYTAFEYSGLSVTPASLPARGTVTVKASIRNSGQRAGAEVVQLYLRDRVASITPSVRRLKRFAKIWLTPGETKEVSFTLSRDDFTFIGSDNHPTLEPGDFDVLVGPLTASFRITSAPSTGKKKEKP